MIIQGTISGITIQRTRWAPDSVTELTCPDYRVKGEFKPYHRLSDFVWQVISQKVIPEEMKRRESNERQGEFLSEAEMLPTCITMLSKQTGNKTKYLMTCMDQQMTTIYSVWFSMNDDFFRQCYYKIDVSDVSLNIKDRGDVRKFHSLGITEEGTDAYWDLASAIGDTMTDCLIVDLAGTDEEDASMYYLTPDWLDVDSLAFSLVKEKGDKFRWSSWLPGGAFRAEATFNLIVS